VQGLGSDDAGPSPGSAVYRCSVGGCKGAPYPFAPNQSGSNQLAQDNSYVYWANRYDGTIWKQHK
jgi:hypothetical protein